MKPAEGFCFHCGEPLPKTGARSILLDGQSHSLCCSGCEAAALWIREARLTDYYQFREQTAAKQADVDADFSRWDSAWVQDHHVIKQEQCNQITVLIEGIRCTACAWLIENILKKEAGVLSVHINPSTARAMLCWNAEQIQLSALFKKMARLGYSACLPGQTDAQWMLRDRRLALKRLVVAGLGMMQAMMFAEALYFGDGGDMALPTRDFFRWIGWAVTTPVVFYSGWPFLRGAWNELSMRRVGMDSLVSLTVLIAYVASLIETLRSGPAVYFDSAAMFVFLLLASRQIEQSIRWRANAAIDVLAKVQPDVALRIEGDQVQEVAVQQLARGDRIRVRPGDVVPVDARLLSDSGHFSEALLTGESLPIEKKKKDEVLAGSHCLDSPSDLIVERTGSQTQLARMIQSIERVQTQRTAELNVADRVASYFVPVLLVTVSVIAFAWFYVDQQRVLPISLAVLAVSCPCALSLALPAALAAAHTQLTRGGVLVLKPFALQKLALVTRLFIDKTGTLTQGHLRLMAVNVFSDADAGEVLRIACALEQSSTHPIAKAILAAASELQKVAIANHVRVTSGGGVEGEVDGIGYRLGHAAFLGIEVDDDRAIYLSRLGQVIAKLQFEDMLRSDAMEACRSMQDMGIKLIILSGDAQDSVAQTAQKLGITTFYARQNPQDKLARLKQEQDRGHCVAMVGDGINDALVLSAAQVSIAMAQGAALAHASADFVLTGTKLAMLPHAVVIARRARRIIRQNFAWAIIYNALGLLAAALGWVPPWLAALGMSLSSLCVTLNSSRLIWHKTISNVVERNSMLTTR
jgi:Cu2+-exporting ATPase